MRLMNVLSTDTGEGITLYQEVQSFIKSMISVRTENVTVRIAEKALKNWQDRNILTDTARMWIEANEVGYGDNAYLIGNLNEMHDRLSTDISKIRQLAKDKEALTPISYTKEERKLEFKYSEYSFKLAETKYQLVEVGRTMHICVGGSMYSDAAFNKQLYIVIVTNSDGEYVCCIEVDRQLVLKQVKTQSNNYAKGQIAEAVRAWVKANPEISYKSCYDYTQMQK